VPIEKVHDRGVGLDPVFPLREAVAPVLEDHLLDRDPSFLDAVGDLLGLRVEVDAARGSSG